MDLLGVKMEIAINKDIYLKMFDQSFVGEFYSAIHERNEKDDYRCNLQRKYKTLKKLESRIIDAIENKYKIDGTPDFFIYFKEKLVGVFEFHPLNEEDFVEVGYWLFSEYRRRGIISSIFPFMIKYAKNNFSKSKILATTSVKNIPSQKLLEKIQFKKTGRILEFEKDFGKVEREIEYIYQL